MMIGTRTYRSAILLTPWVMIVAATSASAADWDAHPVPASPGSGMKWTLNASMSDRFNYDTSTPRGTTEFASRWLDRKPDGWLGPGATYFSQSNYFVQDGSLTVFGSRVPAQQQIPNYLEPEFTRNTYTSYITSRNTLGPGTYTEVFMRGGGSPLSSNFWLLDDGNATEIDVLEIYGDTDWFRRHPATNVHFFERRGSSIVANHNRQAHHPMGSVNYSQTWHRYGVHWVSETLVDFYYDGVLVRSLDLPNEIVDPTGQYLYRPLRLILDMEAHSWRGDNGIPTDSELNDWTINNMQVDWIRTYDLVDALAGDFNDDGGVDALDYALWRENLGAPAGTLANDLLNESIGAGQFAVWRNNFGGGLAISASTSSTIPEPTGAALIHLAIILTLAETRYSLEASGCEAGGSPGCKRVH